MLRILFLTEYLRGGGAEKVLCDLVRQMDHDLFDITVQSIWQDDPSGILPDHVHDRFCYPNTKTARLRFRMEAELGLTYRRHIKDSYDIEIAFLEYAPTKLLAASTSKTAKKIAWVHCDLQRATKNPADFPKMESWYRSFDQVVCVSRSVQKAFQGVFDNRINSAVLYNPVDKSAVLQKAQTEAAIRKPDSPLVCTVGRLDVPKNQLRLLRAHKQLLEEGLQHSLWIIGDGPDRAKLEAFIDQYSLRNSVRLLGFQENPYQFMKNADLLACSSDYEGLSTFVIEGLLLGKPIVTTDCGGMDELLGNSEFAVITKANDRAFTDGLRMLLQDKEKRSRYADQARRWSSNYSADSAEKRIEQFLLSMVED